jgi:hypothetical protein
MAGKPRPKPCYLDSFEAWKIIGGQKVWRNHDGSRLYTWDGLHGEIEVFNARGHHLGVLDAVGGQVIKQAVKGRKIDVK